MSIKCDKWQDGLLFIVEQETESIVRYNCNCLLFR